MSAVSQRYLAQYRSKIAASGQWIAIRRYTGTGPSRTAADTLARAYVTYYPDSELVGTIVQGDLRAITLVDSLSGIMPVNTNDRLMTRFTGGDDASQTPPMSGGKVSGGKETAIKSVQEVMPGGTLIALVLHAVG